MPIQILPPDEAAKRARERVAEWKRQRDIDAAKARNEAVKDEAEKRDTWAPVRKTKPEPENGSKPKGRKKANPKLSPKGQKERDAELFIAALRGDTQKAKKLLDEGADVNARDSRGETVLMWAAQNGYKETVEMLVRNGADANAKDGEGATALMRAAANGYVETTKKLIAKGADVNARNKNGDTALMLAANRDRTGTVEMLKKYGATE